MASPSSSPETELNLHSRLVWADSSNESARMDHFTRWSDEEFRIRFRLSKDTVVMLEQRFRNEIAPKTNR
ncbi:unnamed protein product [Acanthoscelides obtectus]|uniref:Uncharacterized protein n=1 Tax=Acanthoscelides obtectus TaxID=200917 RepID=A0A9P0KNP1_ACAOB|nr:unnamed protein product [Acanthoscelides obtectus]CAK1634277.1 hypothetical protein AOBTE_LOCUS8709 [Acanthoscelides obtectus]